MRRTASSRIVITSHGAGHHDAPRSNSLLLLDTRPQLRNKGDDSRPDLEPNGAVDERRQNLVHSNYPGNRNPFIDHPEWVQAIRWAVRPAVRFQPARRAAPDVLRASARRSPRPL
ncbi:hypothetical protein F9278_00360 [Streptomyces phaeolivaceus]|uniref:Uncharacterized protein n=1 Tax=Streptomyces phaeolivaceus TaxID=2653200 RepID=A0A5P8JWX2_9ACTN|nr:hypothetical protein [Streptomyces phaeolivaceus]QFQ94909.1 hypothetical protein F9278_00360 [Streptomyces phaeolivaceus]